MEFFDRHRNLIVLAVVLFAQVLGLAVQVRRPSAGGPVRLVHLWGISLITPAERAMVDSGDWVRHLWLDYFYLRGVRKENAALEEENVHLRLEQVRLAQDASQAQRLQALFKFKEQFISETVAAQVIGSSGTEQSRVIYIDKGAKDGIKSDMAVVTPDGIVGKVVRVLDDTAQVLEINDQSSGVGAILEKSRLQGIVKGSMTGEVMLHYVMNDEKIENGEMALTSGGDRIFPKGLPIGQVVQVSPGPDTFLRIRVKPVSRLDRVEEVLVITRVVDKDREALPEMPMRAAEILAQRLPSVPPKAPDASKPGGSPEATPAGAPSAAPAAAGASPKPAAAQPGKQNASAPANAKSVKPAAGAVSQGAASPRAVGTASGNAALNADAKRKPGGVSPPQGTAENLDGRKVATPLAKPPAVGQATPVRPSATGPKPAAETIQSRKPPAPGQATDKTE